MTALAKKHNAPLLSCSALRYDPALAAVINKKEKLGRVLSADVWTSAALHPGNPGLLHYGIHGVEILYALMGVGCKSVQFAGTEKGEVTAGLWPTGHIGTVRGLREGQNGSAEVLDPSASRESVDASGRRLKKQKPRNSSWARK